MARAGNRDSGVVAEIRSSSVNMALPAGPSSYVVSYFSSIRLIFIDKTYRHVLQFSFLHLHLRHSLASVCVHDTLPWQRICYVPLDPPSQRKVECESVKCIISHRHRLPLVEGSALSRRRYCPLVFSLGTADS